jgi:hypothetical protein
VNCPCKKVAASSPITRSQQAGRQGKKAVEVEKLIGIKVLTEKWFRKMW